MAMWVAIVSVKRKSWLRVTERKILNDEARMEKHHCHTTGDRNVSRHGLTTTEIFSVSVKITRMDRSNRPLA